MFFVGFFGFFPVIFEVRRRSAIMLLLLSVHRQWRLAAVLGCRVVLWLLRLAFELLIFLLFGGKTTASFIF
jgi:hypothetical protein